MNNTAKLSLMIVRTLVLIFILIQAIKGVCSENISDTLEISDDGKAFIVMKEDISYVDFGKDKANFRTEIVTNVLKIIAIKPFNQTTLWIATVDKEYKLFIIRYKKIPAKWRYDFTSESDISTNNKPEVITTLNTPGIDTGRFDISIIKKRKNMILDEREKIEQVAIEQNNILISVTNIKNDNNCTYIAFKVKNNSSVDYKIDIVQFYIVDKLKKTTQKGGGKNNVIIDEVKPVVPTEFLQINSYDTQRRVYALPLFATQNGNTNGLQIELKENAGSRKVTLEIPIKFIVKADVF